ncbi:hypothetical protein [Phnomibacter sp. MR]|uniref:hypothetical protein n=1 Tax=Phnomibacter sp. MR TaxID=3042318 RepID=UPI003A80F08E
MITVAQYLSFIFSEITRARVIADTESVRIATEYAKDPVMKHFSVPRFKIPELELNIPMVIAGAQYNNIYTFTWQYEEFEKFMLGYVDRFGRQFAKPFANDAREMMQVRQLIKEAYNDLSEMPNLQDLNQLVIEKKEDAVQHIDRIVKTLMGIYANLERVKPNPNPLIVTRFIRIQTMEDLIAEWKKMIQQTLGENIRLTESVLKNLLISPETQIVKTEGTDISILQIRAKITEEGIFVNSVTNAEGEETKVVDFE